MSHVDDTDVVLPAYRVASYRPEKPQEHFKDRVVTPTVVSAVHEFPEKPERIEETAVARYQFGEVIGGIRTADVAAACGLSTRAVRAILTGRYGSKPTKIVICAYLQISLEQLDEIIAQRLKDKAHYMASQQVKRIWRGLERDQRRGRKRGRRKPQAD